MQILLIDDDSAVRLSLAEALRDAGHTVIVATDGADGLEKLRARQFDLIVTDVRMPAPDGFAILRYAMDTGRAADVVLMTGHGAIPDAVAAMKGRALDYLVKPFGPEVLLEVVDQIAERRSLNTSLRDERDTPERHALVGRSDAIAHVREQIDAIAPSDASVLLFGESGTGKELVARALHGASGRAERPFVALNCAAFPHTLLEAELFGHERGAFTGAVRTRTGRFASADHGTLFLDEVSELPATSQAKLLRVVQERCFSRLGSDETIEVDVRLISATNRSLTDLVAAGEFREDLYYRLKVMTIELPPLRERAGDLSLLCGHFLAQLAGKGPAFEVDSAAWAALSRHPFPGNVRELGHALEHATVMARAAGLTEIRAEHLPRDIREAGPAIAAHPSPDLQPLKVAAAAWERSYLLRSLEITRGNKTRAAELLGISRKNLWEKLRAHGVSDAEFATDDPP